MREFISIFELFLIKSQFETLSKKEQKKVIKLLKSKFIDTSDLKVKENDWVGVTYLPHVPKKDKERH